MSEALSDELSQLALPALGEPDYESGPPADGLEYLRRVRHEASRLPHVTRSTAVSQPQFDCRRTAYLRLPEDFAAAPAGSEPKAAWLEALAPQFAALRAALRRAVEAAAVEPPPAPPLELPRLRDSAGWHRFCLGRAAGAGGADLSGEECAGHPPALSLLTWFDEVTALTLLHHAIRWLEEASQLSEAHAAWLFALLARVDTPLDADAGAALRHMCRTLCALRASLNGEHSRATQLPQLNLLISLADAFFHCGLTEPH